MHDALVLLIVAVACVLGFTGGRWLREKHPRVYWVTFPWIVLVGVILLWSIYR